MDSREETAKVTKGSKAAKSKENTKHKSEDKDEALPSSSKEGKIKAGQLQTPKVFQRGPATKSSKEKQAVDPGFQRGSVKRSSKENKQAVHPGFQRGSAVRSSKENKQAADPEFQRDSAARSSKDNEQVLDPHSEDKKSKIISTSSGKTTAKPVSAIPDAIASLVPNRILRPKHGIHSGLKLNPNIKKTTKVKPFSFQTRTTGAKTSASASEEHQTKSEPVPKKITKRRNAID